MSSMVQLAHAALTEAGYPELVRFVYAKPGSDLPLIRSPCPSPGVIVRAVALSHEAAGHYVTLHLSDGTASFDCIECDFHNDERAAPEGTALVALPDREI